MGLINKIKDNKIINFIFNLIRYAIWIVLLLVVIVVFIQRFFGTNFSVGGIRVFNVVTQSMVPVYNVGDIIITKEASFNELKVGDNVTYLGEKYEFEGLIITHQIISKDEENKRFVTKGVANTAEDPAINYEQIYGKVIYKTVVLSYLNKLMSNTYIYYIIFMIIGVILSVDISKSIFEKKALRDDKNAKRKKKTKK